MAENPMHWLEHKIPPPIIGLLCAGGMWLLTPGWAWAYVSPLQMLTAAPLVSAGVLLDALGLMAFRRARTTFNPLRPDHATSLVASGVYRFTRNPMYLGMALLLSGWTLLLGNLAAVAGPLVFGAYITRFQIVPEERVMASKFGDAFAAYCAQVRRWL